MNLLSVLLLSCVISTKNVVEPKIGEGKGEDSCPTGRIGAAKQLPRLILHASATDNGALQHQVSISALFLSKWKTDERLEINLILSKYPNFLKISVT